MDVATEPGSLTDHQCSEKYGFSIEPLYPELSSQEVQLLQRETWFRPVEFECYTHCRERPFKGRFVNVSEHGFRLSKDQGPWPPAPDDHTIFLFGGSTTFGYGVADDQTIASHLQRELADVKVYNFGRGYYISTQERILFEQLLASGVVPDMAIFIDGLNDFADGMPYLSDAFKQLVEGEAKKKHVAPLLGRLPVYQAFCELRGLLVSDEVAKKKDPRQEDPRIVKGIIARWFGNKKLIEAVAHAHGVEPIFVWQPVPTYGHDLSEHPFAKGGFGPHARSGPGYEEMARVRTATDLGKNCIWLADLQRGLRPTAAEPLYVDLVHYSSALSRRIAVEIARAIEREKPR